ncbi:MAG: hypothetical protein DMD89_03805 [Candidatus Rokuibacteriota bacterium]|nr:MAG: hypothetical protein DMD89_03805 [Candidatus Rokubacteria bacterium]
MRNPWNTVRLGDTVAIAFSGVDKHIIPGERSVRLCNYLDVYRNRRLTKEMRFSEGSATPTEIARFTLRRGDLVITKDSETPDDIAVPALVEDDLDGVVCGYHLALLRPENANVSPRFLLHNLQSDLTKRHFLRTANGVTRFGLGLRAIASLVIPLPPHDEQAAIADILDALDTALERTRVAVERARELRTSLIQRLLVYGVRGEKQRRSAAGFIPRSWSCAPLGEFIEDGPTNGVYRPESDYAPHGMPIVRIDDFEDGRMKNIDRLRRAVVPPSVQTRYALTRDDVLINRVNSLSHIGKATLVPSLQEPTIFESNMMRVRCGPHLLPEFLNTVLCSNIARKHWLARAKPAVNQASINQRDVCELPIPIPPAEEQNEIIRILSVVEKQIDSLDHARAGQDQLKRSLLHDLLTGRVRVGEATKMDAS